MKYTETLPDFSVNLAQLVNIRKLYRYSLLGIGGILLLIIVTKMYFPGFQKPLDAFMIFAAFLLTFVTAIAASYCLIERKKIHFLVLLLSIGTFALLDYAASSIPLMSSSLIPRFMKLFVIFTTFLFLLFFPAMRFHQQISRYFLGQRSRQKTRFEESINRLASGGKFIDYLRISFTPAQAEGIPSLVGWKKNFFYFAQSISIFTGLALAMVAAVFVTKQLKSVNDIFAALLTVVTAQAVAYLAIGSFNIITNLLRITSHEKAFVEAELKTAHDAQMSLMPVTDPVVSGFDIAGISIPAAEVGGDYFDYVWLDKQQTKFGIAIADVSGKAMKAAMTAVMTSGMIYREIGSNNSPKEILQKINRPMYLKTSKQMFTALSFAMIDIHTRMFTFSNAGQMHPLLKRGTSVRFLKVPGVRLPLGVLEEIDYSELEEELQPGDTILFFTDGIPEAMNEKSELFGFERLDNFVNGLNGESTAKEITNQLIAAVRMHTGAAPQHDDMTVVTVKVKREK